jgi:polyisoprenoid-binding protein YceI
VQRSVTGQRPADSPADDVAVSLSPGAHPPVGPFRLVPATSRLEVEVRTLGMPVRGRLALTSGHAAIPADPVDARIAVRVAAADLRTGIAVRDRHVTGPAFLDAGRYPALLFESTSVTPRRDGTWAVVGAMTVHGTPAPVVFLVEGWRLSDDGRRLEIRAGADLRRSWFGVTGYRWLIGDRVAVHARVTWELAR